MARGQRLTREIIEKGLIYPTADFDGLRRSALENVPRVVEKVLGEAGLERADVLIVRHLLPDVERELGERLAPRVGRTESDDMLYCYAASLPVSLARLRAQGRVRSGETVVLAAAGSGASWGAMVVEV